ncbi:MAG: N-acetylmuramoyl-L-alanine amidase [Bacilli bacterium]
MLVGIDCGHGMNTSGKRTPLLTQDLIIGGKTLRNKGECIHEFEWNIGVGKYLATALKRNNIDYIYLMDTSGKTDTPLATRAKKANDNKCDIVVSNHYNAYGSCSKFLDESKYKGGLLVLRTQNCSQKSITLGTYIDNALNDDIKYSYNYGLRKDIEISGFTLAILRQTNMPAVLIEYGFMDLWREAKLMLDTNYQKKCAEAVCKGICKYFGITYKKETISQNNVVNQIITLDELNIRKVADWNANPITTVKKGQYLDIVEKVDAKNGTTKMYKLESGLYITASEKFVKVVK